MPVIKVNDQQYALRRGANRVGAGDDADVRVGTDGALGIQAIVDVGSDEQVVIRRAGAAAVRVNGVPLVDPTPLMHGDKVEIAGRELLYSDDSKAGTTQYISASEVAAIASKRAGPARATAATGGRLVSLVDGKEYAIPATGISIGRDASSDVVVAENEVSRKHAELVPVEQGYELHDFSANGVYVNGARIDKSLVLSRADVIRIGTEEFRFYADLAPGAKPTPAPAALAASASPRGGPAANGTSAPPSPPTAQEPKAPSSNQPAQSPLLAILEVANEGPTKGQRYEIRVPLAHIGRGAHNDVVIPDDSVSDTHAKLQRRDDGWYVVDVGSTNGTYVGGQRIPVERRLDGAPDLRFGGVKVVFLPSDAPSDAGKGTRAIASVERAKLRDTIAAPGAGRSDREPAGGAVAASAAPARVAASTAVNKPVGDGRGIPVWVWGVVVLVIATAAAFFLLNR